MLNGLPRSLLDQGNQRNRNVGDHEQREGEHVEDLLTRRCMDVVPFGKRGERTEHEHEEREVEEAEEDRGKRRGDHDARRHYAGNAQHGDNRIECNGDDGQQHCRADGHQHVVACEARTLGIGENTLDQLPAIPKEYLVKALCPTEALVPRITECQRLLVVEHSCWGVGNSTATNDRGSGEFDILGEHMVLPAAHLIDDLRADEEARARNCATGSQGKTSLRKVFRLTHEPYGITCGNPVGAVIFRVAVTGRGNRTVVESLVHFAEVVHVKHIVSVEHKVCLVFIFAVVLANAGKTVIKGVTLADMLLVETGEHDGASFLGNGGRIISAVIGNNKDVDKFLRIVLHANAVNKVANNGIFVSGGNDNRITMILLRCQLRRLLRKRYEYIEDLIHVANREHEKDAEVKNVHKREGRKKLV